MASENGCRAEREAEEAEREKQHWAEIDQLTCDFMNKIEEAERAVYQTHKAVSELTSSRVYDIEMAEGSEGGDALRELDIAATALRHVRRIARWRRDLILAEEASLQEAAGPGAHAVVVGGRAFRTQKAEEG